MKKFRFVMMLCCLGFCLAVLMSTPSLSQQKSPGQKEGQASVSRLRLSYVTNPVGTGLYAIAVAQGQVLSKKTNIDLVVQPAAGPLAIPRLIFSKEAVLGLTNSKIAMDSYRGIGDYSGKRHLSIRILQAGQVTPFGLVTHTGTGIKTIADLKGKRVTWNILTSDLARKVAFYELKAYGIDGFKDVKMLKSETTVTGMQDLAQGRTDATACSLAGSKFEELATKVTPVILPFDQTKIDIVRRDVPTVVTMILKKTGSIPGGMTVLGSPEVFIADKDLDEDTAYRIVKVLLESVDELKLIDRDFSEWTADNAVRESPVPYHPGAIRYYKEAGLWSAKMDENQIRSLK
jgi:TRAP transporter TAXI family solute receptor